MSARIANLDTMKTPTEARELVLHYCNNYLQILQVVMQNYEIFGNDDFEHIKHVKDTHAKFIGKINVACYRLNKEAERLEGEGQVEIAARYRADASRVRFIADDVLSDPTHKEIIDPQKRQYIWEACMEYGLSKFEEPTPA